VVTIATRKGYRICTKCSRNRAEKFFQGERGRICASCKRTTNRTYNRTTHLAETYGLSEEDYQKLFEAQGGACAICKGKRKYNLQVDHCHRTEALRGLLCKACNKGILRSARDNPDTLRNAAEYLENYPVDQFLGRRYTPNGPK
jgi:hypothetical protein